MEMFGYFVGVLLPPVTVCVFVIGMIYRIREWRNLPSPKLTLYPAPEPGLDTFWSVIKATFFFPSLFRADRLLWLGAWIFHASLALILVGHIRVTTDFPALWNALGINADTMSSLIGGLAGVVIMAATLLLTFRRMAISRIKEITQTGDYLTLVLLLAVILTGNAMRVQGHFDLELTRQYFSALILLQAPHPPAHGWFLVHYFLGQLLFIYLPFSKLLHFGGIFFTQTALQRR